MFGEYTVHHFQMCIQSAKTENSICSKQVKTNNGNMDDIIIN